MQVPSHSEYSVSWTTLNNSNGTLILSVLQDPNTNVTTRPIIATVFIAFCLSVIIILTVLGNILVLIALCIDFALRSPTHLLMGNLACADLLLGNEYIYLIHLFSGLRQKKKLIDIVKSIKAIKFS